MSNSPGWQDFVLELEAFVAAWERYLNTHDSYLGLPRNMSAVWNELLNEERRKRNIRAVVGCIDAK